MKENNKINEKIENVYDRWPIEYEQPKIIFGKKEKKLSKKE